MNESEREVVDAFPAGAPSAARDFATCEGDVSRGGDAAHPEISVNADALYVQLTKQIVEDSHALVFTANIDGHLLYANRACAAALSYSPDDLIAMDLSEIVHPDEGVCIRDAFTRVVAGTPLCNVELRLRDRWGAWVNTLVSLRLLRDQHGHPFAISAVGSDISEARRIDEEARARVDLIEEVQRTSEILLAGFDVLGNIVSWNEACERFTSISKTSAIGRPLAELAAPTHEREKFRFVLREIFAASGRESRGEFESCFSPDTQDERSVAWRFVLKRDGAGAVEGGLAIGLPTTERRRAERQRGEGREIVDALMTLLPDATFVTDRRGDVIHWSPAMERLTNMAPSALIARRPEEHVGWLAQSGYASACARLLEGRLDCYESPPRQIEGHPRRTSVVIRALPWRNADGKVRGLVVDVQDVTERLRVRSELALSAACSEAVLQLSHECVHTLDAAGRVIDLNPAACALAGVSSAAPFLGCGFEELVSPVSRPEVLAAFETAHTGQPVPFTYWLNATSGRTVEASAQLLAILDSSGRASRYIIISREAASAAS
ncbi:MAG: PAS domain-containing protein [bacterium]